MQTILLSLFPQDTHEWTEGEVENLLTALGLRMQVSLRRSAYWKKEWVIRLSHGEFYCKLPWYSSASYQEKDIHLCQVLAACMRETDYTSDEDLYYEYNDVDMDDFNTAERTEWRRKYLQARRRSNQFWSVLNEIYGFALYSELMDWILENY